MILFYLSQFCETEEKQASFHFYIGTFSAFLINTLSCKAFEIQILSVVTEVCFSHPVKAVLDKIGSAIKIQCSYLNLLLNITLNALGKGTYRVSQWLFMA